MRRTIISLCMACLICLASQPVRATELQDMDICLGQKVLARMLCKDPREVQYVAKVRKNIYLFAVFYAKQEARFLVGVGEKTIRIQGKEFLKMTRTLSYDFDKQSKCGVVDFSTMDCPNQEPIVCCSRKTVEDKLDEQFWDRPIPDLLEEDLKKALEEVPDAPPAGQNGKPGQEPPKP